MKYCDICGNEIEYGLQVCPFCEQSQTGTADAAPRIYRQECMTINIKGGMPDSETAIQRLDRRIQEARSKGVCCVRVIHGWGSGGTGGKLKEVTRQHLVRLKARGTIGQFIAGENYGVNTEAGKRFLRKHPFMSNSVRTDVNNPGITLVELA